MLDLQQKKAGEKLTNDGDGSEQPWPEALKAMTAKTRWMRPPLSTISHR